MRYRFCGKTYTRMCCTSHPLLRKWAAKAGSNWRNLAAAVGEGTCTLQPAELAYAIREALAKNPMMAE